MIIGIGTDIIEIKRIENAVNRSARFLNRIFTVNEIDYIKSRKFSPQNIAGNFAAKEAISKALGTGISGIKWKEIEIIRKVNGAPLVILHDNALKCSNSIGIMKINVSISHSQEYAIAFAIAEGEL